MSQDGASTRGIRALLVDPALFTGPYDASLTEGLLNSGVDVQWASRPLRRGEVAELPPALTHALYYRGVQDSVKGRGLLPKLRKGLSHLAGGERVMRRARRGEFNVAHFQWAVFPAYDAWLFKRLRQTVPVVLTIHDLTPFNGDPTSRLQSAGLNRAIQNASHVVVHREDARQSLIREGSPADKITVIPHGPLALKIASDDIPPSGSRSRWTIVLFGKLQPYKGLDILVEALGLLSPDERTGLRVVVAGEVVMDLSQIEARIGELGLDDCLELRRGRLSEIEMAKLFAEADAFVFPYRHIEASGVLFLIWDYGKWIIASDLGAFRDMVGDGVDGCLVPAGNPAALAVALRESIGRAPNLASRRTAKGWDEIGVMTRTLYEKLLLNQKG